jgi:hypothetical protein
MPIRWECCSSIPTTRRRRRSRSATGLALLRQAQPLLASDAARAEIEAALSDSANYVRLMHAAWLIRHKEQGKGVRLAREVVKSAARGALRERASALLEGPRPIQSAPALVRINGCGVGLYGARDRAADGSYVATHCVSVLFIPVFPLAAYRVIRQGGGSYLFLCREPLSRFALVCRRAALALAVATIAVLGTVGYLESPGRARRGELPEEISAKLKAATDREQGAIFHEWLGGQLDTDPELKRLQAQSEAYADLPPACLALGMLKLRRARAARGGERKALLAQAEQVFLAIRDQAERVLAQAREKAHPPTLAAAEYLLADRLIDRAEARRQLTDAETAVAALRRAEAAWPDLQARHRLAWTLVD